PINAASPCAAAITAINRSCENLASNPPPAPAFTFTTPNRKWTGWRKFCWKFKNSSARPEMQIRPEQTMKEIMAALPGAQRALFRRSHLGGCASCAFPAEETLASLCQRNNLNPAEVIRQLQESHQQDEAMQISPAQLQSLRGK